MKETGRAQSEREIERLRKQNQAKSPVKEHVRKFEGKSESPVQENAKKFETKSKSPTTETSRSKSPNINKQRPSTLGNASRSKSPGLSSPLRNRSPGLSSPVRNESPGFSSPLRSKSPGLSSPNRGKSAGGSSPMRSKSPLVNTPTRNESPVFNSPNRSKSPGIDAYSRSKSPGIEGYNRSKSPGNDTYTRSKSPGIKRAKSPLSSSPTRSKSPGVVSQSPVLSPTKAPSASKWTKGNQGWAKESPIVAEKANNYSGNPDDYLVGDTIDISWYFDNIEEVTDTKAQETNSQAVDDIWPGAESPENLMQDKQRFRNSLNYNIAAWNDEEYEDIPKTADDFIQRMCDQVRNQVEYMCGMNLIKYQAVSYKVRVAGAEGIFYYVKVNVWQNYCIHLRIFTHKNELKAIPALQAILERAQPDNGNIEFF